MKEDMIIPKIFVERLIHYYHTTNGLYATDLEQEASKMSPNTFWRLEDETIHETVKKIEEMLRIKLKE